MAFRHGRLSLLLSLCETQLLRDGRELLLSIKQSLVVHSLPLVRSSTWILLDHLSRVCSISTVVTAALSTQAAGTDGRVWPDRLMTAPVASSAIAKFIADVASKMGFIEQYKPAVVRSDKGSAFVSYHFREFLADRQVHLTYSAEYTPQQNSHIERFWGITFGTARVLLAAANLPPTFHPFAMQAAVWITNRLPRPSRGGKSPFQMLSHKLPDISYLYAFGCLCATVLPIVSDRQRRPPSRLATMRRRACCRIGPSGVGY